MHLFRLLKMVLKISVEKYIFKYKKKIFLNITSISKYLSGKYSLKHIDNAKKSAADAIKTASQRIIRKTAETIDDFNGDKIADLKIVLKIT